MCRGKKYRYVLEEDLDPEILPRVHYMREDPQATHKWHIYNDCNGLGNTSRKIVAFKVCEVCYKQFLKEHDAR